MSRKLFRRMTRPQIAYWYEALLPEGFAPNEIKPWTDIERLLNEDRYEIWGLFTEDRDEPTPDEPAGLSEEALPVGFACLWKREGIPLVLLDYMGVTARLRSCGLGAWMLGRLREQGRPLVLESEMPVDGALAGENDLRRRRIAFYERNGFRPVYEMATCGLRWQALLAEAEGCELADVMRWHKQLYDEKRTDVQVPLGPGETPAPPYWMAE